MVRIKAVQAIRDRLRDRGYLEVETPVLNLVQGGANPPRPFVNHYNALDIDKLPSASLWSCRSSG